MKNPWRLMTYVLGVLFIFSLLFHYYSVSSFQGDFENLQAKYDGILADAKNQGVQLDPVRGNQIKEQQEKIANLKPEDISSDDDPFSGNEDAEITLIVFNDLECPYCGKLHDSLQVARDKFSEDQLRIVYRDYPLPGHPNALPAAKASWAAFQQGQFFPMLDLIFANARELSDDKYLELANELGLDIDKFKEDMASEAVANEINGDIEDATSYGVSGTPALYLNGEKIGGALGEDALVELIEEKLGENTNE